MKIEFRFRPGAAMAVATVVLGALAWAGCGGNSNDSSASTGLPAGRATRNQVLRGRYLATTIGCSDCHSTNGDNPADGQWLSGFHAGTPNQSFAIGPFTTYAANLTQDKATGLGNWTAQDIFNVFRNGKDKVGRFVAPPMPWPVFRNLNDDDTWALVAYLQSIKAVTNAVPESQGPPGADGKPDWSSVYQHLPTLPAYPAANETNVP